MTVKYKLYCKNCKKECLHIAVRLSRKFGVRYSCLKCCNFTNYLEVIPDEYKEPDNLNENDKKEVKK